MAKKKSRHIAVAPLNAVVCVVCDSVSHDPNTGKPTLYGLFDIIWAETFPCRVKPFALYAKIDGKGKHRLSIHLADPKGHSEKLGEAEIRVSPNANAIIQADFVGVEFKRVGKHELLLRVGRKIVGRTSFQVKRKPPEKRKK